MQDVRPGEHATVTASDAKQIIADGIRLRVVTVSVENYAAEDVLAGLKNAGYELRKK